MADGPCCQRVGRNLGKAEEFIALDRTGVVLKSTVKLVYQVHYDDGDDMLQPRATTTIIRLRHSQKVGKLAHLVQFHETLSQTINLISVD